MTRLLLIAGLLALLAVSLTQTAQAHTLGCTGAQTASGHSPAARCDRVSAWTINLTHPNWELPDTVTLIHRDGRHYFRIIHRGH